MSYSYTQQRKKDSQKPDTEPSVSGGKETSLPNSALLANPGHRVDMPVVMREKMEGAFGMNLSGVKLYENKAVGEAWAEAVSQGSKIAFAPGKLDFSSTHGQALLGHEISHVASQTKGEVKGSGLVNDSALEARADREGMMAARGESVMSGFGGASAALSNASAASASGPMQAKSGKNQKKSNNSGGNGNFFTRMFGGLFNKKKKEEKGLSIQMGDDQSSNLDDILVSDRIRDYDEDMY